MKEEVISFFRVRRIYQRDNLEGNLLGMNVFVDSYDLAARVRDQCATPGRIIRLETDMVDAVEVVWANLHRLRQRHRQVAFRLVDSWQHERHGDPS